MLSTWFDHSGFDHSGFDRPRARIALLLFATAWLLGGCAPARDDGPRLVVLYATCTLNKDFLSPYNAAVTYTPNLARFAEEGVVLERHQTEAGQSGPAFASIFTGVQADRHGIYNHPTWLVDDVVTIGEAFRDRGHEPHFWNKHAAASGRLNFGQGVDEANVVTPESYDSFAQELLPGVLTTLQSDADARAFVKLNFTVTHSPYHNRADLTQVRDFLARHPAERATVTDEELQRYHKLFLDNHLALQWSVPETVANLGLDEGEVKKLAEVLELIYKTSVHELDRLFGDFVERIEEAGLAEETVLLFTADHGEVLYRENALFKWTHGGQLAPEVLNVRCIVRAPGLAPGRYAAVTRSIDVFPTVLGLTGLDPLAPGTVDGVDLAPALRGEIEPPDLYAFSHTCIVNPVALQQVKQWPLLSTVSPFDDVDLVWASVRHGDRVAKLVRSGPPAEGGWRLGIFDLAKDPTEARDLYDGSEDQNALGEKLREYKVRLSTEYARHVATNDEQRRLDAKRKARILRDLGYIR
jgi:arylsulfatase A-like enzyme